MHVHMGVFSKVSGLDNKNKNTFLGSFSVKIITLYTNSEKSRFKKPCDAVICLNQ